MAERKWLKSEEFILFSVQDGVARITLNRPEKRNAINRPMLHELHGALLEADDRKDVNVIILQGAGKDFCAGWDLVQAYDVYAQDDDPDNKVVYRSSTNSLDDNCWSLERDQVSTTLMFELHKPVIAKVHGNCLAGGTDLALGCDLIVAATDARIGYPATRANGTPPNQWWVYHCGPQWAKRMLFTGDSLNGADAARIGLVMDAMAPENLDEEVDELARRIACIDAELLSAHKRIVNTALELAGAKTLQRMATEMDGKAHFATGPRRKQFKADMAEHGLKEALKNRDAPFGDGRVRLVSR